MSILSPEWRHLSVCFGAVVPLITPLKSNLFRYGKCNTVHEKLDNGNNEDIHRIDKVNHLELTAPGRLAQALYFQPHVGAPMQPTKSKSMAAAHLNPSIWGTLFGLALHHNRKEKNDGSGRKQMTNEFRSFLRTRHGIKSNHVNDEWTGVSLARWEELYDTWRWPHSHSCNGQSDQLSFPNLCSDSLWSMMLWDICTCKRDVLDAFLAIHEAYPSSHNHIQILDPRSPLVDALLHDESARVEWASSNHTLTAENMAKDDVDISLTIEQLLRATQSQTEWDSILTAQSIENLCSHYLSNTGSRREKPPTPNGYYSYDNDTVKPDCVEVTVRELIDLLLWDEQQGSFDLSRLPSTAHPILYQLYRPHDTDKGSELEIFEQTQGRGQEWFDALSNLNGCEYLTRSANGKPYELTPTMRNVAKVFQRLFLHSSMGSSSGNDWTTLDDVGDFWNKKPSLFGRVASPALQVSLGKLSHRAAMSDYIIVHEVAMISLEGSNMAMDIRLRNDPTRNSGFATVTHLRQNRSSHTIIPSELCQALNAAKREGTVRSTCLDMMLLLGAQGNEYDNDMQNGDLRSVPSSYYSLDDAYRDYLGCRTYGLDRRKLMEITATADLEREELAVRNEQRHGDRILKNAIHQVSGVMRRNEYDHHAGLPLLNWLLSECPDVHVYAGDIARPKRFHDKLLEETLLTLPPYENERLRSAILENDFIRGSLLLAWMDWKSGKTSLMTSLLKLRPFDALSFLRMILKGERKQRSE